MHYKIRLGFKGASALFFLFMVFLQIPSWCILTLLGGSSHLVNQVVSNPHL